MLGQAASCYLLEKGDVSAKTIFLDNTMELQTIHTHSVLRYIQHVLVELIIGGITSFL